MTKIKLYKNPDGFICGFLASGHASSEQAGNNIYCAAVSAITQTAAIGLEEVAKVKTDIKMQSGKLIKTFLIRFLSFFGYAGLKLY